MLQLLHIENIAVIERADISFRAGFNALTGETGAGKSIVIDSLGAVLGARTSRDLIRTGAAKAFVSAEFDGVDASLPVLAALGVKPEECLMVGNDATEDMAAREVGMDVFLLTDCLINAKNRDLNAYPRGDFAALNAYIDALQ